MHRHLGLSVGTRRIEVDIWYMLPTRSTLVSRPLKKGVENGGFARAVWSQHYHEIDFGSDGADLQSAKALEGTSDAHSRHTHQKQLHIKPGFDG